MPQANNPAQRLLTILEAAKQQPDQKAENIWGALLGVADGNKAQLLRRLGLVMELPFQIKEEIERIPQIEHAVYLKWMPAVEASFSNLNLGRNFSEFKTPVTATALYGLEVCSEILSRYSAEKVLNPKELDELDADVNSLMDELLNSDIDRDLKSFVLSKLDDVHLAILDYKFAGVKPMRKAVEAVIGSIAFEKELHTKLGNSKFSRRFWGIMTRTAMVVTIVAGTVQITDGIKQFLPDADIAPSGELMQNQTNAGHES